MNFPHAARYNYCCHMANEFLMNENITKLPFDSDVIIKKEKWARIKYSKLALKHNITIKDVCEAFGSQDGYSIFNGNNYTIAYNDTLQIKQRIYFTKLHEIGHIYLGHFRDFKETILNRANITKTQYKVLENEANCFARNVLAPAVLIKEIRIKNTNQLSEIFGITSQASRTRLSLVNNDIYYLSKQDIIRQKKFFHDFIYKKHCFQCGNTFISENAKCCPICGHDRLTWGDGEMIYEGYELDENGKALVCPRCGNEQINPNGSYCNICGTYLINECSNYSGYDRGYEDWADPCGQIADGNARYCIHCGARTTFYNQGLLKDWQEEKAEIEKAQIEDAQFEEEISENIPDIPF